MRSPHLYLSPCREEHAEKFTQWINDPKVYGHIRDMSQAFSVADMLAWICEVPGDPFQEMFALYYLPEDKLIGNCGFKHINPENKTAEIWRVIGETDYWGKGLGSELFQLVCRYGFEKLGFRNILGEHFSNNPASLKSALKSGAKFLGTRRKSRWIQGEQIDINYTDILPEELVKPETP